MEGNRPEGIDKRQQQENRGAKTAQSSYQPRILFFLLALGISLRAWAYFRDTSLYLDEILLSRNILDLPLAHLLTQPLALDQVAPRGFLLFERLSIIVFGPSEMALRLVPFLCGTASLFLFRRLAEKMLPPIASAVTLFLFTIGVPFIRFGAEVKQYECDLLAAIVLTLLALKLVEREASTQRLVLTGLAGFLIIWFSQASVLVMAGIGFGLALEWILSRERKFSRALLFTIPLWAVASLVAIVVGMRSMTPSTKQFMNSFWAGAFLPRPFHWGSSAIWIGQRFLELFFDPTLLRYKWPIVFALLAAAGIVVLWMRNRVAACFLCGPPLVALAAAIAHQYPFRGRLAFWLLPAIVLTMSAAADWIRGKASALHPAVGVLVVLVSFVVPVIALAEAPPPYELEHTREILSYLQQHRQPGDIIYVMQLSEVGIRFYGPSYGLQPSEWISGACDFNDSRVFLRDVDRFRGVPRLWVVTGAGRALRGVHTAVRNYLGTIGTRRDAQTYPSMLYISTSLDLYDLSDAARWPATNAETFPVPPMSRDPKIGCREWTKHTFNWDLRK